MSRIAFHSAPMSTASIARRVIEQLNGGRQMKIDFAPWPHLDAWSARRAARPAHQRVAHAG